MNKYTQELAVIREQLLKTERTVVAREQQLKVITKENEAWKTGYHKQEDEL